MSRTTVSISGEDFLINGIVTFAGRSYQGNRVEGLLPNSRMIQGIFDDLNAETRSRWDYPDGPWDAERNVREFIAAMPDWRAHGLLGIVVGLQGGSPEGYSGQQPWVNSAFAPDGSLREAYMERLGRILDRADELGMVPIVSYFYFGQDERLEDEAAVIRATDLATDWLLQRGDRHVLVEIANESSVTRHYEHKILWPDRIAELIERVRERSKGQLDTPAGHLLTGASFGGGDHPSASVMEASDLILPHGNGVNHPDGIREMVKKIRAADAYRGQPIVFNEDDHFAFEEPDNNFLAAVESHASWGYFDYRMKGEGFAEGYQSMPCDWGISSARKRGFFELCAKITGTQRS